MRVQQQTVHPWRAKHPTILDAFAGLVSEDRELMDIYLAGTPVQQLFSEIACGDARLGGIKVEVPIDRYDGLMSRIEQFSAERGENRNAVNCFLAFRCGTAFLERFLERNPEFTSCLHVMSYFYAVSDIDVINKLHRVGLLLVSVFVTSKRFASWRRGRRTSKTSIVEFLSEVEIKEILF